MKPIFALSLIVGLMFGLVMVAHAGEEPILTGCAITATAPSTASSGSDVDCVWAPGTWLTIQCDVAVYYTKTGTAPTSASPKIAAGDPYPVQAKSDSAAQPIKILPVVGAATCYVYKSDKR